MKAPFTIPEVAWAVAVALLAFVVSFAILKMVWG